MEEIQLTLIQLFDEMLTQVKFFRRKSYEEIFLNCYKQHKGTVQEIEKLCTETSNEERDALMEQIAHIIPQHAMEQIQQLSKGKKNRQTVDYNLNMAVYITPLFSYEHLDCSQKIADRMVEIWNELNVTGLTLARSSYEDIASGFKKGVCFITTAVCEYKELPDDCHELTVLRGYRDSYLLNTLEGTALVDEYYEIAPGIVRMIDMQKNAPMIYEELYESWLTPCIRHIEAKEPEACKALYTNMVLQLKNTYLYS